jgi:hypothetical protein
MRFIAAHPEKLSPEAVEQCYMAGMEGLPWPSTNTLVDSELLIKYDTGDSGNLFITWQAGNHSPLMLMTGSLAIREEPYLLEVELARGTVHRLRQYIAIGRLQSIPVPARVSSLLEQATLLCCQAVTQQENLLESASCALESIERCLEAIEDLVCWDGEELLKLRLHQQESSNILIGFASPEQLDPSAMPESLANSFNMTTVPVCWKKASPDSETLKLEFPQDHLSWCEQEELKLMAGPIISFAEGQIPDRFNREEGAFNDLQSECKAFVSHCVEQFKDHVDLWHAAAGLNRIQDMNLSEEQCVRLAIDAVETIRKQDQQTPVIVSFDQPWGEYLTRNQQDLSPLHFADALVRADLGINGIGMEINWQQGAGNTQPRDLVALANELDRWTLLQMPLVVFLTAPTELSEDDLACSANRIDQLLTVILGRPSVQVVIWNRLLDATEGPDRGRGILDPDGREKPVLQVIDRLYQQLETSHGPGEITS